MSKVKKIINAPETIGGEVLDSVVAMSNGAKGFHVEHDVARRRVGKEILVDPVRHFALLAGSD